MIKYYQNSIQHILDELTRIDLLLHLQILKFRSENHKADRVNKFQGLFISEQEVNNLIASKSIKAGSIQKSDLENPQNAKLIKAINIITRNISERIKASNEKGVVLNLLRLVKLFSLSLVETDILLICLAPQVDLKYEKLFAYLQDDITRKHPSVDLILNLLCNSSEEKISFRVYFSSYSPLFKFSLLEFINSGYEKDATLLTKPLKMNDRITEYLLGKGFLDNGLMPVAELYNPQHTINDLLLLDEIKDRLSGFFKWYTNKNIKNQQNIIFSFYGQYGSGKKETAGALCQAIGLPLLIIDLEAIINLELPFKKTLELAFRESLLLPAPLYLKHGDFLFREDVKYHYQRELLLRIMNDNSWLSFISTKKSWEVQDQLSNQRFIQVEYTIPNNKHRQKLWRLFLNRQHLAPKKLNLNDLACKFNFTAGQIRDSVASASNYAFWRSPVGKNITIQDLYIGCHAQSNQKLRTLSQKINPKYTWQDIVLPRDQMAQLYEITNYVKYKGIVYGEWGFDGRFSLGKGLNVLFSGPSGTGKTMAAEIMANELKLDLYKIDLSTVVSKYIGETEKNLSKIFSEAEDSNAILFFDEADALFGKRTEVRDSHDRYANIEISYLLQELDEYRGVAILATNLRKNIDGAFVRRMHFIMEFPFPEENYRLRIWQNIFPKETPLSQDIDFNFLAFKFKFAGGNIKNIALAAAFYAANDGGVVTMENIIQASRREYQKMGKLCAKADFGEYYELISK